MENNSQLSKILPFCDSEPSIEQQKPSSSSEYFKIYEEISQEVTDTRKDNHTKISEMMDMVYDGNLYSLEGFSTNKNIEIVQKKANELMLNNDNICHLTTTNLNIILNAALDSKIYDQEDKYYQKIRQYDDKVISAKPSNFMRVVSAHPERILTMLKASYLLSTSIVKKELVSFVWVFLDTIRFYVQNTHIEISMDEVGVILYVQKYATPYIDTDELVSHITAGDLKFDDDKYSVANLTNRTKVEEIILHLQDIHVIVSDEGKISLAEKVDLNLDD